VISTSVLLLKGNRWSVLLCQGTHDPYFWSRE
jgi:hypothetical protein